MDLKASCLLLTLLMTCGCSRVYREDIYEDNRETEEWTPRSHDSEEGEDGDVTVLVPKKEEEHFVAGKYTLYTKATTWINAVSSCWRKGAELAVPRSREDAVALGRMLANATGNITEADMKDAIFVGLTDMSVEGEWKTLHGSFVAATGYTDWLGGRQELNTSANCGALLADGRYLQQACETQLAYACEPGPSPVERADGYVDIPSVGTYKIHTEPLTWAEAGLVCEEEGATLAVPSSPLAAGLLAGTLVTMAADEKVRREGFFVGINDLASEGVWRTILDDYLTRAGFNTWSSGEPSGGRAENCGALLADGRYADYPCSKAMAFACEMGGYRREDVEPSVTDGVYSLYSQGVTWFEAFLACHRRKATLATPRNRTEFDTLRRLARQGLYRGIHMGAFFNGDVHTPHTNLNGERIFFSYMNENYGDGKCLLYSPDDYHLSVTSCSHRLSYICENSSQMSSRSITFK